MRVRITDDRRAWRRRVRCSRRPRCWWPSRYQSVDLVGQLSTDCGDALNGTCGNTSCCLALDGTGLYFLLSQTALVIWSLDAGDLADGAPSTLVYGRTTIRRRTATHEAMTGCARRHFSGRPSFAVSGRPAPAPGEGTNLQAIQLEKFLHTGDASVFPLEDTGGIAQVRAACRAGKRDILTKYADVADAAGDDLSVTPYSSTTFDRISKMLATAPFPRTTLRSPSAKCLHHPIIDTKFEQFGWRRCHGISSTSLG